MRTGSTRSMSSGTPGAGRAVAVSMVSRGRTGAVAAEDRVDVQVAVGVVTQRVVVRQGLEGLGIADDEVHLDVREGAPEDPVVAGARAAVDDLGDELVALGVEEPEVPGFVRELGRLAGTGAVLEVAPGHGDVELVVLQAEGRGVRRAGVRRVDVGFPREEELDLVVDPLVGGVENVVAVRGRDLENRGLDVLQGDVAAARQGTADVLDRPAGDRCAQQLVDQIGVLVGAVDHPVAVGADPEGLHVAAGSQLPVELRRGSAGDRHAPELVQRVGGLVGEVDDARAVGADREVEHVAAGRRACR